VSLSISSPAKLSYPIILAGSKEASETFPIRHPDKTQRISLRSGDNQGASRRGIEEKMSFEGGTASLREKPETQFRNYLHSGRSSSNCRRFTCL
jgi:hypothetical protein